MGVFTPKMIPTDDLGPGEIGFITAAIKTVADCNVGDTITDDRTPATEALPGFKPSIPVVWCGLYPVDADDFEKLREVAGQAAAERRQLPLRAGDLGGAGVRLPLRLPGAAAPGDHPGAADPRVRPGPDRDRAHRWCTTSTGPTGEMQELHNPVDMPDGSVIDHIEEPWIKATIMVPDEYLGSVLALCTERRGRAGGPDLCRQPRHGGVPACR